MGVRTASGEPKLGVRGGTQGGGSGVGADEQPKRKRTKDLNGIELRMRARQSRGEARTEALTELERRRCNLRGAVIPAWERERRGQDPADWDLLR